jgi:hypothetical protein
MTKAFLNLDTAIGTFVFVAECDNQPNEVSLALETLKPQLSLPAGMSVVGCRAVVLRVATGIGVAALRWSCEAPPDVAGSPCSGEGLDAQEWEANGRLVVVGTEDEDALAARLGFVRLDATTSLVRYSPEKLEMKIPGVPPFTTFDLHFVLAENTLPEPVDASAWFAVDIPHRLLTAPDAA